jgi:oligopeptide/dipeptide ABC transporter ATP-binding protein
VAHAEAGPPIIEVDDLRLAYVIGAQVVHALQGVSLTVGAGEVVGLVGESGSGKSTLARALMGLTDPRRTRIDGGRIAIDGRDVTHLSAAEWERLRGHPLAMVFQDPLNFLNPVMRAGRQIGESVRRHDPGVPVAERVHELLELVRLPPSSARAYPHELSGGMRQRVLLAVALGCRPRLLIADEPTTALDVTTQAEIMVLLGDLCQSLGMAMLLISHDLGLVADACERINVMYAGRIIEWGARRAVFGAPGHPYTIGLLQSAYAARDASGRFVTIGGEAPNLARPAEGCPFAPRCGFVLQACGRMPEPAAVEDDGAHTLRCWNARGVRAAVNAASEQADVG